MLVTTRYYCRFRRKDVCSAQYGQICDERENSESDTKTHSRRLNSESHSWQRLGDGVKFDAEGLDIEHRMTSSTIIHQDRSATKLRRHAAIQQETTTIIRKSYVTALRHGHRVCWRQAWTVVSICTDYDLSQSSHP